jgi:hypothetical protein
MGGLMCLPHTNPYAEDILLEYLSFLKIIKNIHKVKQRNYSQIINCLNEIFHYKCYSLSIQFDFNFFKRQVKFRVYFSFVKG